MHQPVTLCPIPVFFLRFLLALLFCLPGSVYSQRAWESPYRQTWRQESLFLMTGALTTGIGYFFKGQENLPRPAESFSYSPQTVNSLDRIATSLSSTEAADASDLLLNLSCITPAILLAGRESRRDIFRIGLMFFETALINNGLTQLTKYTIRRPRPFLYDPGVSISQLESPHSYTAFVSGHTSATAANCFFVARVFSDYYPNSRWKPVVWGAAAAVPAVVGYLRIRAGKHFPTDVIAGYALGATIGLMVPRLHQSRSRVPSLSFTPGFNGASLNWRLNGPSPEEAPALRD